MTRSQINILLLSTLMVFAISSCKKKKDDPAPTPVNNTPTTPAAPSISSAPLVQFEINSTAYSYAESSNIENTMGTGGSTGTISTKDFSSGFDQISPAKAIIDFEKGTITYSGGGDVDTTVFKNYFAPGSYSFSPVTTPTLSTPISGIVIQWWDSSNVMWSTEIGTGDQTGSNFTIVASKQEWPFSDQLMKVYATFNCKLYDGNGNTKTLTNGKFVGYYGNF